MRVMQNDLILGHKYPKHTAQYARAAGRAFEGLWR